MARRERNASAPVPWPFSVGFEFLKAKKWDAKARTQVRALYNEGHHVRIEEKCDGWRVLAAYAEGDRVRCFSRGISEVTGTNIDLIEKFGSIPALSDLYLGPGDAIEAELIWPGHRAAEVPTALGECRGQLQVRAFGVPFEGGKPLGPLRDQMGYLVEMEIPVPRLFGFAPHLMSDSELDEYAKKSGFEGWMFKADTTDEPLWWKHKRECTADVVVLDTKDSEGYVRGTEDMVGSLVVGILCRAESHDDHECWDLGEHSYREIAAVSGITDEEREAMTKDRDNLPGRVCEILFQAQGGKSRLRHPRFVRWRPDKPACECTGSDLPLGAVEDDPDAS